MDAYVRASSSSARTRCTKNGLKRLRLLVGSCSGKQLQLMRVEGGHDRKRNNRVRNQATIFCATRGANFEADFTTNRLRAQCNAQTTFGKTMLRAQQPGSRCTRKHWKPRQRTIGDQGFFRVTVCSRRNQKDSHLTKTQCTICRFRNTDSGECAPSDTSLDCEIALQGKPIALQGKPLALQGKPLAFVCLFLRKETMRLSERIRQTLLKLLTALGAWCMVNACMLTFACTASEINPSPVVVANIATIESTAQRCEAIQISSVATDHAPSDTPAAFEPWLLRVQQEAISSGLSAAVVQKAMRDIEYLPGVVDKLTVQPERILTSEEYVHRQVDALRVQRGAEMMRTHAPLLRELQSEYGVPANVLVAMWGMESSFGRFMGQWPTLSALATLAFSAESPARCAYFQRELVNALRVVETRRVGRDDMTGSWAGAIGQCQFMPSAVLKYAVDHDRDGIADIVNSTADALASMANFLQQHGWQRDQPVALAIDFDKSSQRRLSRENIGLMKGDRLPVEGWKQEFKVFCICVKMCLIDSQLFHLDCWL